MKLMLANRFILYEKTAFLERPLQLCRVAGRVCDITTVEINYCIYTGCGFGLDGGRFGK